MKLDKIEAGSFLADGGAMFGVVPKRVWQKRYPCNEENFCTLVMRCLVIKTDEKLIVIDTGTGDKQHYGAGCGIGRQEKSAFDVTGSGA